MHQTPSFVPTLYNGQSLDVDSFFQLLRINSTSQLTETLCDFTKFNIIFGFPDDIDTTAVFHSVCEAATELSDSLTEAMDLFDFTKLQEV